MKNILISIIYMIIGILFFYLSKKVLVLKNFAVTQEKIRILKYLALLYIAFGVFEIYLSIWSAIYFFSFLDQILVFKIVVLGAIIALSFISSFNLKMRIDNQFIRIFDLFLFSLGAILISIIIFIEEYTLINYVLLFFITVAVGSIFFTFVSFSITSVPLIKSKDPIEKASGLGALIALVGGFLASLFFTINRLYGGLFGFMAILSQVFLLVMLYGFYVNIEPPDFIIKLFSSGD